MGWNSVFELKGALFSGIPEGSYFYFVHSYFAPLCSATTATCEYGLRFSASIQIKNWYGVQFHPEKSGEMGEKLLKNFLEV